MAKEVQVKVCRSPMIVWLMEVEVKLNQGVLSKYIEELRI